MKEIKEKPTKRVPRSNAAGKIPRGTPVAGSAQQCAIVIIAGHESSDLAKGTLYLPAGAVTRFERRFALESSLLSFQ